MSWQPQNWSWAGSAEAPKIEWKQWNQSRWNDALTTIKISYKRRFLPQNISNLFEKIEIYLTLTWKINCRLFWIDFRICVIWKSLALQSKNLQIAVSFQQLQIGPSHDVTFSKLLHIDQSSVMCSWIQSIWNRASIDRWSAVGWISIFSWRCTDFDWPAKRIENVWIPNYELFWNWSFIESSGQWMATWNSNAWG